MILGGIYIYIYIYSDQTHLRFFEENGFPFSDVKVSFTADLKRKRKKRKEK